jgi:hypothetical protein
VAFASGLGHMHLFGGMSLVHDDDDESNAPTHTKLRKSLSTANFVAFQVERGYHIYEVAFTSSIHKGKYKSLLLVP